MSLANLCGGQKGEDSENSNATSVTELTPEQQFNAFLANSLPKQMKQALIQLQENRSQFITIELDEIAKQIAIADRIIEVARESELIEFAIESKLNSMIDREILFVENGLVKLGSTKELAALANDPQTTSDASNAELATIARSLVKVIGFLSESSVARRADLRGQALPGFMLAIETARENQSHAMRLSSIVQLIQLDGARIEAELFAQAFIDSFSETKYREVADAVSEMEIVTVTGKTNSELADILNTASVRRDTKIKTLLVQIEAVFSENDIASETVLTGLKRASDLIRIGRIKEARFIQEKSRRLAQSDVNLKRRFQENENKLSILDTDFETTGLLDVNQNKMKVGSGSERFDVLLFISTKERQLSIQAFNKISNSISDQLADASVKLTLVFLITDEGGRELAAMLAFAHRSGSQGGFLHVNTAIGREFLKRFPLDSIPQVVVLEDGKKILAIDPPLEIVAEILNRSEP